MKSYRQIGIQKLTELIQDPNVKPETAQKLLELLFKQLEIKNRNTKSNKKRAEQQQLDDLLTKPSKAKS